MKLLACDEKCFRKIALLAILGCLLLTSYLYLDAITDRFIYKATTIQNSYFVNEQGCRIVGMEILNPRISNYLFHMPEILCKHRSWFRTAQHNGKWHLDLRFDIQHLEEEFKVNTSELSCRYRPMLHFDDHKSLKQRAVRFRLIPPYRWLIPKGVKVMQVSCLDPRNMTVHLDVQFSVQPPPPPLLQGNFTRALKKWPNKIHRKGKNRDQKKAREAAKNATKTTPLISVMVLGIDALSHLNFVRQMPLTARFIRHQLPHVEFWGYSKIGRDSYPNLIPLLSGLSPQEFSIACRARGAVVKQGYGKAPPIPENFDRCPLLWQQFKSAGYNTSYGEDGDKYSLFNNRLPGFKNPPTDHYLMTVLAALRDYSASGSNYGYVKCAGDRAYGDLILELIAQLLPHKQRRPFFSYYWWSQGLESFNFVRTLDTRFYRLLKRLHSTGITNNTFILLMSDHGQRWGPFRNTYQGMMEDNQPMLFALYPPWLRQLYPQALANLERNDRSLLTSFDLHETLKNLLNLEQLEDKRIAELQKRIYRPVPRGLSLFLPVPTERSCGTSRIPPDFCLCHRLEPLDVKDARAQRAARHIVRSINDLLLPYPQCRQLQLDQVLLAYHSSNPRPPDKWNLKRPSEFEIKLRLQTLPGEAQFEATTRFSGYTMARTGEITRIGKRRLPSYCLEDVVPVGVYCYCGK